MGSSPAQSHSTRPAHTATVLVGHSGDGFEPWDAHPTGSSPTRKAPYPHCCVTTAILDPVCYLLARQLRVSGSATTRGSPAARDKTGDGGWAARGMFCFSKAAFPATGGWGRCQDPQLQPPPWEAPSQLQSLNTQEQWKQEGRKDGGGPSQTKAL